MTHDSFDLRICTPKNAESNIGVFCLKTTLANKAQALTMRTSLVNVGFVFLLSRLWIVLADNGPVCRPELAPGGNISLPDCAHMLDMIPDWPATIYFWRQEKPGVPSGAFITPFKFTHGSCVGYISVPDDRASIHGPSERSSFRAVKTALTEAVTRCVAGNAGSHKGGGGTIGMQGNLVYFVNHARPPPPLPSGTMSGTGAVPEDAWISENETSVVIGLDGYGSIDLTAASQSVGEVRRNRT